MESYKVNSINSQARRGRRNQITLKNALPSSATTTGESVKDIVIYYYSVPGMEFKLTDAIRVGTLEGGSSAIASFPIRILPNANGGILSPSFQINQQDVNSKQKLIVPVPVVNPPILTISVDKQALSGTDAVSITISNNGGTADKVILQINSTKFAFSGSDQVYVGEVTSSNSKTISVSLDSRNAADGINSVPFVIIYQQEGGETKTETKYLSLTVKKEKADVAFTQTATIMTSKDNLLKLKVKNTGRTLEDFRVVLDDESIKSKEANEIKLGTFTGGDEKDISFNVFAGAQPGVQSLKLTLKWVEQNVEKQDTVFVPLVINSDADVGIFLDAKPSPLAVGGEHTLSVLVSNIGSYKINNVEVSLNGGEVLEILNAQKSQYIGGLDNDDFSTVQYKTKVFSIAPGTYPLTVAVKYKDQSGVWIEKNITREVTIRSAEDVGKGGVPIFIYVIGIAIIGAALYVWYKGRKPPQQHHA